MDGAGDAFLAWKTKSRNLLWTFWRYLGRQFSNQTKWIMRIARKSMEVSKPELHYR
jgi:hypothetical protein